MMAPADRVRVAMAPSIVMRFSSLRDPLMLNPPLLRLSGWKLFIEPPAPPRTPGLSRARLIGLRPFSIRSWICLLSIVFDTCPVLDWSGVASPTTVTASWRPPGTRVASTWTLELASTFTLVFTNFLKPLSSTETS